MLPASILGNYSTRVSLMPSYFLRRIDLLGTLFLIILILDLFYLFSFLGHHIGHTARFYAWILLYKCALDAL
jgi:hypothetical protein